jgi:hypothetical protein
VSKAWFACQPDAFKNHDVSRWAQHMPSGRAGRGVLINDVQWLTEGGSRLRVRLMCVMQVDMVWRTAHRRVYVCMRACMQGN